MCEAMLSLCCRTRSASGGGGLSHEGKAGQAAWAGGWAAAGWFQSLPFPFVHDLLHGRIAPHTGWLRQVYQRQRKTMAVDVFSLGCVVFFILIDGQHPFDHNAFNVVAG